MPRAVTRAAPTIALSLDKITGQNGDTLELTIETLTVDETLGAVGAE